MTEQDLSLRYMFFDIPCNSADRVDRAKRMRETTGQSSIDMKVCLDKHWCAEGPPIYLHMDYVFYVEASMFYRHVFGISAKRTRFPYQDIIDTGNLLKQLTKEDFEVHALLRRRRRHYNNKGWTVDEKEEFHFGPHSHPDSYYYPLEFFDHLKTWHLR